MKKHLFGVLTAGVSMMIGCAAQTKQFSEQASVTINPVMVAKYTSSPIVLDGKLDDPAWKSAVVYSLSLSDDLAKKDKKLTEAGEVRLAWDENYLYLGINFTDSDIVAEGEKDQLHHYLFGDLAELFLKPEGKTWYWELYVTPLSMKTSLFFPGRGRLGLKSADNYSCGLKVAAHNNGTVNQWTDRDTGWTAEMAMPIKDLTARGETFGPGSHWKIFVGRYNYSRYLNTIGPELSMTPPLSMTNYHRTEEYAVLQFQK
jgi:hypothetical protein